MLEYTKTILIKVSFSKDLFRKELQKSRKWLCQDELAELEYWCLQVFDNEYRETVKEVLYR